MSINIALSQDQINQILLDNDGNYFQVFCDDNGTETIDERSTFPEKLKFYMKKNNKSTSDLISFFTDNYPLVKSKASVQHYLTGVRTPKLSVVFAIAECLGIAPANLLPGVPGKYIEYTTNHVEMLSTPTYFEPDQDFLDTGVSGVDEECFEGRYIQQGVHGKFKAGTARLNGREDTVMFEGEAGRFTGSMPIARRR